MLPRLIVCSHCLCAHGKFTSPGLERRQPRSTTPDVEEVILDSVHTIPSISTRRLALHINIPHTTVWRLLREQQMYPYLAACAPADYPARVMFCQWFLQQRATNPNLTALVLFTDEAQFTRNCITNYHNQHVWAYENPHVFLPSHYQVLFLLNMWASIIGDQLVVSLVIVNRLKGQPYTNSLRNTRTSCL